MESPKIHAQKYLICIAIYIMYFFIIYLLLFFFITLKFNIFNIFFILKYILLFNKRVLYFNYLQLLMNHLSLSFTSKIFNQILMLSFFRTNHSNYITNILNKSKGSFFKSL